MARVKSPLMAVAGSLLTVLSLEAVEIADLVGDWSLADVDCPAALRETFYNSGTDQYRFGEDSTDFAQTGEAMTDANYPNPFHTGLRSFAITGTGAVTGGETGQILNISGNRIFYSDGTEETTVYSNTTGDLMLTSSRDPDQQDQTLCLKRPASLTTSQLAGDWRVLSFNNRADLQKTFNAGRVVDTFYLSEPSNVSGVITVLNDGSFTGLFSGNMAASGTTPGDITVTVDGNPIPFRCNASINVCVGVPADDNEKEVVVLVRKPASLATADLAGTWRISAMIVPTTLTEVYYNSQTDQTRNADNSEFPQANESLVDLVHADRFEMNRLHVLVDASGAFTGSVSGSLAASGNDAVTVNLEGEVFSLHPNADKTFMAGLRTYASSHELIYMVKVCTNCAPDFEGEVDMQPVVDGERVIFSWNNGSNLSLQSSATLGGWTPVEGADGSDTHAVSPSGTRFYQVSEAP